MRNFGLIGSVAIPALLTSWAFAQSTASVECECAPVTGQPAADVLALFEGRVARYKHPREVVCVERLPRNAMGKVQ